MNAGSIGMNVSGTAVTGDDTTTAVGAAGDLSIDECYVVAVAVKHAKEAGIA